MEEKKTTAVNESLELAIIKIGDLTCGIDTLLMKEINKLRNITPVHGAPRHIRGVVNLRGQIVTVIDLREKFGLEPPPPGEHQQTLVINYQGEDIGLLVDRVEEVVEARTGNMEPPPSNIGKVTGAFFSSILKMEKDLVAILKIEEIAKTENDFVSAAG